MEALALTILSVFAFLGAAFTANYFVKQSKTKLSDTGIKLILYLPHFSSSKLEGILRQIFLEELPEKLMSDGKIYLIVSPDDKESLKLIESLKNLYPLEVLPDNLPYCMITEREKVNSSY